MDHNPKEANGFSGTREIPSILWYPRLHYRHLSLSRARLVKLRHYHTLPLRLVLILSFHLCLRLPSGFLPSGFPTKIVSVSSTCMCYMPYLSHTSCLITE